MGEITFDVPQVRKGDFYPEALEKGLRSERALTMTLAEMYIQGVSTRKVTAILEQLCGTTSDDHQGLKATRMAVFGGAPWLRCQNTKPCNKIERPNKKIQEYLDVINSNPE